MNDPLASEPQTAPAPVPPVGSVRSAETTPPAGPSSSSRLIENRSGKSAAIVQRSSSLRARLLQSAPPQVVAKAKPTKMGDLEISIDDDWVVTFDGVCYALDDGRGNVFYSGTLQAAIHKYVAVATGQRLQPGLEAVLTRLDSIESTINQLLK